MRFVPARAGKVQRLEEATGQLVEAKHLRAQGYAKGAGTSEVKTAAVPCMCPGHCTQKLGSLGHHDGTLVLRTPRTAPTTPNANPQPQIPQSHGLEFRGLGFRV